MLSYIGENVSQKLFLQKRLSACSYLQYGAINQNRCLVALGKETTQHSQETMASYFACFQDYKTAIRSMKDSCVADKMGVYSDEQDVTTDF